MKSVILYPLCKNVFTISRTFRENLSILICRLLWNHWHIQAIWETSKPIWMPKNHILSLLFSVVFQQEEVEVKEGTATKKFSFNYAIDHANVHFFYYVNNYTASRDSSCTTCWIFSAQIAIVTSLKLYNFFIWIYEFFKNHP